MPNIIVTDKLLQVLNFLIQILLLVYWLRYTLDVFHDTVHISGGVRPLIGSEI